MVYSTKSQPTPRRVILLEDEALSRMLLTEVLTEAGFLVSACENSSQALKAFKDFDPDALIFDINLGDGTSGVDLMVSLLRQSPDVAGVLLSNYQIAPDKKDKELQEVAFIDKRELADPQILITTLNTVLSDSLRPEESARFKKNILSELTSSQLEVLRLVALGLSNQEIADRRETSLRGTEQILNRLFTSLGIKSDTKTNPRVVASRMYITTLGIPER